MVDVSYNYSIINIGGISNTLILLPDMIRSLIIECCLAQQYHGRV